MASPFEIWSEVPSFQVSTNTKTVYRVHLSALHASDAAKLSEMFWPIFGKLSADNPFRRALLQVKATESAAEYRSARSHLLAGGVDTIYFLVEAEWQ